MKSQPKVFVWAYGPNDEPMGHYDEFAETFVAAAHRGANIAAVHMRENPNVDRISIVVYRDIPNWNGEPVEPKKKL